MLIDIKSVDLLNCSSFLLQNFSNPSNVESTQKLYHKTHSFIYRDLFFLFKYKYLFDISYLPFFKIIPSCICRSFYLNQCVENNLV